MKIRPFFTTTLLMVSALAAQDLDPLASAKRQVYKTVGDVSLAAYIFTPEGHQASDQRPAALLFFGGSWSGGTPAQFVPQARYLATRGMIGIVADYRVSGRHKTTPFECVKDGKSAVRWVRSQAHKLGIDPNRLAVGGGSAGGHVAAATATAHSINEVSDDLSVSAIPDALLLFNPVYDNGPTGYGYRRLGGRFAEISPMHNLYQGMPPAIVFLGTEDSLITVDTAKRFQRMMRDLGDRSDLFLYDGQPHGFFNASKSPQHYYQTVLEMDRFLCSLGYLSGDPTIHLPQVSMKLNKAAHLLDIAFDGRPLARYEFSFDPSTPERRLDTYKPFLHVYDRLGKRLITKGAGGRFTHHRGIFLGFSRVQMDGKQFDLWHMKQGVQHQSGIQWNEGATGEFTSRVNWSENNGSVILKEDRQFRFLSPPIGAYALIEMHSNLTAVAGDLTMGGDPEHAGAQFRPADDIIDGETTYTFHQDKIDPKKDLDLPWVNETFRLKTGNSKHSVVILNHPNNPKGTRFSAYRDYGRFGAFPEFKIKQGKAQTLRYRWVISSGKMLGKEVIEQAYADFAGS